MITTKNRCKYGHELTAANQYKHPTNGYIECKVCRINRARQYKNTLNFGGLREYIIQRDGEQCVKCGITRTEHQAKYNKDICVDHIDNMGVRQPKHLKNNNPDNLQTLCHRCNMSKDHFKKKLTPIQIQNIIHSKGAVNSVETAKMYGVTPRYVRQLRQGKWYKELDDIIRVYLVDMGIKATPTNQTNSTEN